MKKMLVIEEKKIKDRIEFNEECLENFALDKVSKATLEQENEFLKELLAGRILTIDKSIEERAKDWCNPFALKGMKESYIQGCADQQIIEQEKSEKEKISFGIAQLKAVQLGIEILNQEHYDSRYSPIIERIGAAIEALQITIPPHRQYLR